LALLCLLPSRFKKISLLIVSLLSGIILIFFGFQILFYGLDGRCNCLLLYLENPSKVILPFSLTAFLSLSAYFNSNYSSVISRKAENIVLICFLLAFPVLSFLFNTLSGELISSNSDYSSLSFGILYENENKPDIDLLHDKHVVALMSFNCPHCKIAAKKLRALKKTNPNFPIYMILEGNKESEREFFMKTGSSIVNHYKYVDSKIFWKLSLNTIPTIYFLNDGKVESKIHYKSLNKDSILKWLNN
jgi:thiol-disulfide isomerase/thioredoxin